jgi:hypothetical protein
VQFYILPTTGWGRHVQSLTSSYQLSELVVFLTAVTFFFAMEQRVNTKFCLKLGKPRTETCEMLQTVYSDEALSRSGASEWFKRFKDGRENLQYDPRSGRPSASRNTDIIANVH